VIWYPVLLTQKGELHDYLKIYNEDGAEIHVLSSEECFAFVTTALRILLNMAYAGSNNRRKQIDFDHRPTAWVNAEAAALATIQSRQTSVEEAANVAGAIERLEGGNQNTLRIAAEFVERLARTKATVIPVVPSSNGRFMVRLHQTVIPRLYLARKRSVAYLCAALGIRPESVNIAVPEATNCMSYDLTVTGRTGTYLSHQELVTAEPISTNEASKASEYPYHEFQTALGQSYAHFHARAYSVAESYIPVARVRLRFAETPPGSIFRAAITAVATAILIWLVACVTPPGYLQITDAPAFLLVVPSVAGAWLGADNSPGRLFGGSFMARLCLATTAVSAVAASGLFMLYKSPKPKLTRALPDHASILGIGQWAWLIIVGIAAATAVIAVCECAASTIAYLRTVSDLQKSA
jgi:hypothetical protein